MNASIRINDIMNKLQEARLSFLDNQSISGVARLCEAEEMLSSLLQSKL